MKTFLPYLVLTMVAAAGCQSTNSVEPAQPVAHRQYITDKRVVTNPGLGRAVKVLGVNAASTPDGFLKVQVEVQNVTWTQRQFTYKFEWFDEAGILIHSPTDNAQPHSLEGQETWDITATAPTPQAKDFRLQFMPSYR